MRSRSRRRALLLALGALGALAFSARLVEADLETTLPPGTANDWSREFPERIPRLRGIPEKPRPKDAPKIVTQERKLPGSETRVQPELASTSFQPMIFSGVLTVDLPRHCDWVKREGELAPRRYPPPVTDDLYWMAQTSFLRRMLHPSLVPESEIYWHLVALGEPAREVAKAAKSEPFLSELAKSVDAAIPDLPPDAPEVPAGGDSPEEKMLVRLARDDLATGDPYSLDPSYAEHVLALGEPAFPALAAAAVSSHALLRRNATALLGEYPEPEATDLLEKLWKDDPDAVVRTRALFHLARKKDAAIVPDLAAKLASNDARLRPLVAYALGRIGTKEAVGPLVQALDRNADDWETIVAATIALARAGPQDPSAVVPALRKLVESLTGPAARFVEPYAAHPRPDNADADAVRNRMLLELATIALARLGDRDGLARMNGLVSGKWESGPIGHAPSAGPERKNQCDCLKTVCPTSHLLLVETWGSRGAEGLPFLEQVIASETVNERLRVAALRTEVVAKDKRLLQAVFTASTSATLRAIALKELAQLDEKLGVRAAESVIGLYVSGKPVSPPNPRGDVTVVAALEVLEGAKKLKLETIKSAAIRALGEFVLEKPDVSADGMKPFRFSPPILETCAWMAGALGDKSAFSLLKLLATSTTVAAAHGEAVRALAHVPGEPTNELLVALLESEDGWVRYNAYLSLRALTSEDHFADWIYGSKEVRRDAVDRYRQLLKKPAK
jgi:HEAT repeat protein